MLNIYRLVEIMQQLLISLRVTVFLPFLTFLSTGSTRLRIRGLSLGMPNTYVLSFRALAANIVYIKDGGSLCMSFMTANQASGFPTHNLASGSSVQTSTSKIYGDEHLSCPRRPPQPCSSADSCRQAVRSGHGAML